MGRPPDSTNRSLKLSATGSKKSSTTDIDLPSFDGIRSNIPLYVLCGVDRVQELIYNGHVKG
ncbi:hypothetical protein HanIR_Chr17g0902681 [Helianthus annuus]|nr:hypothetical protein HanIR_Chr17g0902681 [Helianthus annuus]